MVLILSSLDDQSTNDVIDWLRYYECDYLRISDRDQISYQGVALNNNSLDVLFNINETSYKLSEFTSFWYRRSHYKLFIDTITEQNELDQQINAHLTKETNEIHRFVKSYIATRSINKYADIFSNKLEVLWKASQLGLRIPSSIITTKKSEIIDFSKQHNEIITKNFSPGIFIYHEDSVFSSFTKIVTPEIIGKLPDTFKLSLFQEKIEKLFELRVFFLNNTFYTSAIFSQNDDKTKVDFRDYNFEKPNRTPPYQLEPAYEEKLRTLMHKLGLNSGSIDLLVTANKEYIFLEVNPIGQFQQVSAPCNYQLEREVARTLIQQ